MGIGAAFMESQLRFAITERGRACETGVQFKKNAFSAPERVLALPAPFRPEPGMCASFQSRRQGSSDTGLGASKGLCVAGYLDGFDDATAVIVPVGFLCADPRKGRGVSGLVGCNPCGSRPAAECGALVQL